MILSSPNTVKSADTTPDPSNAESPIDLVSTPTFGNSDKSVQWKNARAPNDTNGFKTSSQLTSANFTHPSKKLSGRNLMVDPNLTLVSSSQFLKTHVDMLRSLWQLDKSILTNPAPSNADSPNPSTSDPKGNALSEEQPKTALASTSELLR